MRSRFVLLLTCALLFTAFGVTSAATTTRPNFTGAWKLNPQKSKFADSGPEGFTVRIIHQDNHLTEALTFSGGGGEHTIEAAYTADGKESEVLIGGEAAKATVKWEGDALVIEWRGPEAGRFFGRKLTLAADGKTITILLKQNRRDGSMVEETWVLEKQ
jgi:hypothetical protein